MKNFKYLTQTFPYAVGVFAYVSGIAYFIFNAESIFNEDAQSFLIPVFMLLLFIVSATITSALVLYKPIQLFLSGEKKPAILTLVATLTWLILFLLLVILRLSK
ncbi:MAG: hypothetical protein A2418_00995 [Candidatus Brennerbacteria bacterium RIFOXYC1_FULL_41_11]|uniref:Uncharacterized protein n=1 Tax=Candidatus Brennerbacteria bacterium RIFOXYD1_FULL_41_16 TaxID=1797529 RepID=A0A1G1XM14_9BACT|nr:MAG: hypothetical protein A2391_02865 [Candidatus Brennerbacteria bacterium RIFOXYB1_FULL_41_13]OGY40022.1 MAG: hypothetical protein A2418_00995 [Candidatus Brennerbacteria bacterium RIFOXYC1_FULL_41_11]OGY40954.1 MAG: hypothetical protein A2570_00465 [Candidatus Brennerbacteria bacterium RIFOXYD1_FULL_41_16]